MVAGASAFALKGTVGIDTGPLKAGIREAQNIVSGFGHAVADAGRMVASAFTGAAVAGFAAGAAGIGIATKEAASFEKTMSGVKAVTGVTAQEMKTLQKLALDLGAATSFSAKEAGQGIEELAKAGVSVSDIMGGAAKASLDLAAAGEISVAEAAEIASNAMNAFSLKGKDMPKVADLIAGAANASAISVNDFRFAMQSSAAVAATVGLSFDDLAQSIAIMGNAGIKGSDAGTSIKSMLMGLQPQTDKQIKLFRDLGIVTASGANQFFDAQGKIKSMAQVSQILQDSMKGMTDQQKIATLEVMFGSDAVRAAAIFAKEGAGGFAEMAAAMGKVTATQVAETRLDNLSGSVEKLKGSLSTVAITVGLGMTPAFRRIVDMATEGVNAYLPVITTFAEKLPDALNKTIDRALEFGPKIKQIFIDAGQSVGAFVGLELDDYAAGWDTWVGIIRRSADLAITAVSDVVSSVRTAIPTVIGIFQEIIPVASSVGQGIVTNLANTIRWVTTDIVPPLMSIFRQTADFFLTTLQPAITTTTNVFRGILGESLAWLAKTVWPPLLGIAEQTAAFWTGTLLPAIQSIAGPIRTVLGESIQWLSTVAWPALLSAAKVVVDYFTTSIVPLLPDVARQIRSVLGDAIKWIGDVGWPLFLSAAKTVSEWITGTAIPAITDLVAWIGPKVNAVVSWLINEGWPMLLSAGRSVSTWITGTAIPALTSFVEWIGPKVNAVVSWLIDEGWPMLLRAGEAVSTWITDTAIPAITPLVEWLGVKLHDAAKWVYEVGWPKIVETGTQVSDWYRDTAAPAIEKVWLWLNDKLAPVVQWFIDTGWPEILEIGGKVATMYQTQWENITKVWDAISKSDVWDILSEAMRELWEAGKILVETFWPDMKTGLDGAGEALKITNPMIDALVQACRVGAAFVLAFATGVKAVAEGIRGIRDAAASAPKWLSDWLNGGRAPGAVQSGATAPGSAGETIQNGNRVAAAPIATGGAIDNSSRASFVRTAFPYFLNAAGGNKDLAEWMLAKAISENGDVGGGGDFIGNNFSGIKGKGPSGKSFTAKTWEWEGGRRVYQDAEFAVFDTIQEGIDGFMQFLKDNKRYAPALGQFNQTGDARGLFEGILSAGYATNPAWVQDLDAIRTGSVLPITKDIKVMTEAVQDSTAAIKTAAQECVAYGGAMDEAGEAISDTASVTQDAARDISESVGASTRTATNDVLGFGATAFGTWKSVADASQQTGQKVSQSFNLMSAESVRQVTQMAQGFKTQMADASGNVITTTTNMRGNIIDQTATLANGVKVNMADLAQGTVSSVEQMANGVKTTMTDAKGNVITTVTDMSGQVIEQTATMAAGASQNAQKLGTEVSAQLADMSGRTLTLTRTMAGDLVSTIRDATGGVVQQYRVMANDVSGQAAALAQASAVTNGQISSGAQSTFNAVKSAAQAGAAGYDQFGRAVSQANQQIRGFTQDAKWLAEHGFIVPGYAGDPKWLAEHGFIPGRHTGGSVMAGQSYWVGEKGIPELYTPKYPGQITPANQIGYGQQAAMSPIQTHVIDIEVDELLAERIYVKGRDVTIKRTGQA